MNILGENKLDFNEIAGIECTGINHSESVSLLRMIYSAVDVLALPSEFESFGLVAQEAIMGIPVVSFFLEALKIFLHKRRNVGCRAKFRELCSCIRICIK